MDYFALLPDELVELILRRAELKTFCKAAVLNRRFSSIVRRDDLCFARVQSVNSALRTLPPPFRTWAQYLAQFFAFVDVVKPDNPFVFFEIDLDGRPAGTIVMELYAHNTPKTAENFLHICVGDTVRDDGEARTYAGSPFHRVIPDFMAQGGDIVSHDGRGSDSIFPEKRFKDENFNIRHNKPFLLSMANSGPNSNGCQFFITFTATPWLDRHHVVFGQVVNPDGRVLLKLIETKDGSAIEREFEYPLAKRPSLDGIRNKEALDFTYSDEDTEEAELSEFYTLPEMKGGVLEGFSCFHSFFPGRNPSWWKTASLREKRATIDILLEKLEISDSLLRLHTAYALLFLAQGSLFSPDVRTNLPPASPPPSGSPPTATSPSVRSPGANDHFLRVASSLVYLYNPTPISSLNTLADDLGVQPFVAPALAAAISGPATLPPSSIPSEPPIPQDAHSVTAPGMDGVMLLETAAPAPFPAVPMGPPSSRGTRPGSSLHLVVGTAPHEAPTPAGVTETQVAKWRGTCVRTLAVRALLGVLYHVVVANRTSPDMRAMLAAPVEGLDVPLGSLLFQHLSDAVTHPAAELPYRKLVLLLWKTLLYSLPEDGSPLGRHLAPSHFSSDLLLPSKAPSPTPTPGPAPSPAPIPTPTPPADYRPPAVPTPATVPAIPTAATPNTITASPAVDPYLMRLSDAPLSDVPRLPAGGSGDMIKARPAQLLEYEAAVVGRWALNAQPLPISVCEGLQVIRSRVGRIEDPRDAPMLRPISEVLQEQFRRHMLAQGQGADATRVTDGDSDSSSATDETSSLSSLGSLSTPPPAVPAPSRPLIAPPLPVPGVMTSADSIPPGPPCYLYRSPLSYTHMHCHCHGYHPPAPLRAVAPHAIGQEALQRGLGDVEPCYCCRVNSTLPAPGAAPFPGRSASSAPSCGCGCGCGQECDLRPFSVCSGASVATSSAPSARGHRNWLGCRCGCCEGTRPALARSPAAMATAHTSTNCPCARPRALWAAPDTTPFETLYGALLPSMPHHMLSLLKILLASAPCLKSYTGTIALGAELGLPPLGGLPPAGPDGQPDPNPVGWWWQPGTLGTMPPALLPAWVQVAVSGPEEGGPEVPPGDLRALAGALARGPQSRPQPASKTAEGQGRRAEADGLKGAPGARTIAVRRWCNGAHSCAPWGAVCGALFSPLLGDYHPIGAHPSHPPLSADPEGQGQGLPDPGVVQEVEMKRQKEIITKGLTALLLLILKHAHRTHILQFEYICQLVTEYNGILLLLSTTPPAAPTPGPTLSTADIFSHAPARTPVPTLLEHGAPPAALSPPLPALSHADLRPSPVPPPNPALWLKPSPPVFSIPSSTPGGPSCSYGGVATEALITAAVARGAAGSAILGASDRLLAIAAANANGITMGGGPLGGEGAAGPGPDQTAGTLDPGSGPALEQQMMNEGAGPKFLDELAGPPDGDVFGGTLPAGATGVLLGPDETGPTICLLKRTSCSWRNTFVTVAVLRVLQYLTKRHPSRIRWLVHYKAPVILKRMMRLVQPELELYVLKLLKSQVKYMGKKWKQSNMRAVSAIYRVVRPELVDDWLEGDAVDNEQVRKAQAERNNALRQQILDFNHAEYFNPWDLTAPRPPAATSAPGEESTAPSPAAGPEWAFFGGATPPSRCAFVSLYRQLGASPENTAMTLGCTPTPVLLPTRFGASDGAAAAAEPLLTVDQKEAQRAHYKGVLTALQQGNNSGGLTALPLGPSGSDPAAAAAAAAAAASSGNLTVTMTTLNNREPDPTRRQWAALYAEALAEDWEWDDDQQRQAYATAYADVGLKLSASSGAALAASDHTPAPPLSATAGSSWSSSGQLRMRDQFEVGFTEDSATNELLDAIFARERGHQEETPEQEEQEIGSSGSQRVSWLLAQLKMGERQEEQSQE
ncbi:putative peptidyl-prolyl cis-trans isomerase H [Paratrimastix pyriformis]|uniref:Peptidyl-prolyl cis-trans isomerase H n=1 Tax=Paratrimastix pyriformis TaxID=342808 RepID=A0ABQ8UFH8_9EUKA|nr:putative peptidyl-prolyl cis-trans isomerase H [Paratrimastix pyriformis]